MPTISFGSNEPEVKVTDTVEDTIESKTEDTVEYNSETSSSETMKIDLGVDVPVEAISKFGYLDYDTILFAQQQAQDAGFDTEITGCINGQREWVTSQPGIIKVNEMNLESPDDVARRVGFAAGEIAAKSAHKKQRERIEAQKDLAETIALWAGREKLKGYTDRQIRKRFMIEFGEGITVMLSMPRKDMIEFNELIKKGM